MTLRVAHIIYRLGVGGAERHLVNLMNAMSCDYRMIVCVGGKRPGAGFYQDLDPAIEQYFVRVRRRSLPIGIMRLAYLLKKNNVDVVHTHMFISNLYGSIAARLAGVPVVVTTEHGENPWKRSYHRWLERRVISPLVDTRFCVSQQILERRRDRDGVPASKLVLAVNGTVVPPMRPQRSPNAIPVVGSVGRLIPAKGYLHLLDAVAELRRRGYSLELSLVGDGPENERINKAIDRLQLRDLVNLPGLVTDVDRWYERFDVYVSSSIREGLPVALLEAMAHGLPVVATDVGAMAQTVQHEVGGLIVPPGDATALADALGDLLDSPERRAAFGANSRERVERDYSVKAVAQHHLKVYSEILASRPNAMSDSDP